MRYGPKSIDYFEDIDRLYDFPLEKDRLWKVVRKIRHLDRFRENVIRHIRWEVPNDCAYDKKRIIYVHPCSKPL